MIFLRKVRLKLRDYRKGTKMPIQNFKDIYNFLSTDFPTEECTTKDLKEEAIYNSEKWFLCMIIDKRFNNFAEFKIMKPYIWIGSETDVEEFKDEIGWGWLDEDGNYIDNYKNPVHSCDVEDWYVIGFIDYKNNNDIELWSLLPKASE